MKKTFSFCLFCFISVLLGMAQSDLKQAIIQKGKNNSIREEYFIRQDSVKEGPYKYYYKNTLLHEGSYAEGKRHGLWRFYNGSGDLTFEGTFANDLKNGKWLYYNKGKIKAEQYFTNNQKDSTWIKNYPSGKPEYIINYRNNTKNGETRLFHENGQVSLHCNYVNGVLEGDYLKYYNNAQLLESSHYKEGNLNGNCKVYYRNGNLFLEVFFDEGRLLNIVQQNDFNGKNIDLKDFQDGNGVYRAYYLPDSREAELKINISHIIKMAISKEKGAM
ncbi:MAG: toxin-antitoxin system YwqK family antitoxin [Bacteroidia bacterium]|nr:toxin-antitoxin system YwqK family antitoxin [Bacteroidia bacterium]